MIGSPKLTYSAAVTDAKSLFTVTVPGLPAMLRITPITYGFTDYEVTKLPDGPVMIRISPVVTSIDEVQITGERMHILTREARFSIQEFAIDQDIIWFLGFINNQATSNGGSRLIISEIRWPRFR